MKIKKTIFEAWQKHIDMFGIMVICKTAGVNYRTLKNAMDTGEINPKYYPLIISALIKLHAKRVKQELRLTQVN